MIIGKNGLMHCPKCDFGMMELVGGYDVVLESGKISKCPLLNMECLMCHYVSMWRRQWSAYKMRMKLQKEDEWVIK